jgi:subtilisin family serine protease
MASPHVAGVAARYLASTTGASPAQVRNQIVNNATTNGLSGVPAGTANRLLFWSGTR